MLTEYQKQHAIDLIETGDKLEAVKYLRETLNIPLEQALALAEKLEEEVEGPSLRQAADSPTKPRVDPARLVSTIFMIVGVIMLGIAFWIYRSHEKFYERAVPVPGKVTGFTNYESSNDDGGSTTMYTPVFEYEYNGQTYTQSGQVSSSSPDYEVGEQTEILVNPDDPNDILVDSFMERWFAVLLLGFLGTLFTGLGYVVHRYVK